jgi:hypothetical protein
VVKSTGNGADRKLARKLELERYARLSPRDRLEAVASSPQATQLIRAMPPHALYRDIAEVGLASSTEVVRLASPAQFRVFIDLAGWKKDRIDFPEVVRWLRAARGSDEAEFLAKVRGLDTELLELILTNSTRIHSLEENPDARIQGQAIETPSGKYAVEFSVEGVELSAIRALVKDLLADDPFGAERLLEALRWDLPSELEEASYRFRMARLEDLGFPALEQAMSIFTYVDPATAKRQPRAEVDTRKELAQLAAIDPWAASTPGLSPGEVQTLDEELRYLANCALVAEGAEPGDPVAIRRVTQMVRSTLRLGLEFLGAKLGELPPKYIFQVGFSLGLRLKFRADRLARQPLAMVGGEYLLFPEQRALLLALRLKRPGRPAKDETGATEPFQSLAEISEAEASLTRAEEQAAIFAGLLGPDLKAAEAALFRFGAPVADLGPELVFRAVVANAVLFGEIRVAPVPKEKLGDLWERLFERGADMVRLKPAARERAMLALRTVVPESSVAELERSLQRTLETFLSEWGDAFQKATVPPVKAVSAVVPLA